MFSLLLDWMGFWTIGRVAWELCRHDANVTLVNSGKLNILCYNHGRLIARFREASTPRDSGTINFSSRSEIWQPPRQQRRRDACQFLERYDHYNTQFAVLKCMLIPGGYISSSVIRPPSCGYRFGFTGVVPCPGRSATSCHRLCGRVEHLSIFGYALHQWTKRLLRWDFKPYLIGREPAGVLHFNIQ